MSDKQPSSPARCLAPFSAISAQGARAKIPPLQRLVTGAVKILEKNGENGRKRPETA